MTRGTGCVCCWGFVAFVRQIFYWERAFILLNLLRGSRLQRWIHTFFSISTLLPRNALFFSKSKSSVGETTLIFFLSPSFYRSAVARPKSNFLTVAHSHQSDKKTRLYCLPLKGGHKKRATACVCKTGAGKEHQSSANISSSST
jgi:hypothetical protein